MIKDALGAFQKARDALLRAVFFEMIKPVADRYDWEIDWAMGGVSFTSKNFEDVTGCKTVQKLEKDVRKITDEIDPHSQCDALWDALCYIHPAGSYHKSHGRIKDFDERIRKQVKRR